MQVHSPFQVPHDVLHRFSFIDNLHRRHYAALAATLDSLVGNIVDALIAQGMWENTLLVFSSDNGGPAYLDANIESIDEGAANNWPLRGGKLSNWEGGVRVNAFVGGGLLPVAARGRKLTGLTSIEDWCVCDLSLISLVLTHS